VVVSVTRHPFPPPRLEEKEGKDETTSPLFWNDDTAGIGSSISMVQQKTKDAAANDVMNLIRITDVSFDMPSFVF